MRSPKDESFFFDLPRVLRRIRDAAPDNELSFLAVQLSNNGRYQTRLYEQQASEQAHATKGARSSPFQHQPDQGFRRVLL